MSNNLDKYIRSAINIVVKDGGYQSHKEFTIPITEDVNRELSKDPIGLRIDKAVEEIRKSLINDGWRKIDFVGPDTCITNPGYTPEQLKELSEKWSKPRLTKEEWERQAINDGWVKIPKAECSHDWREFQDEYGHKGEKCLYCFDFRHMYVDDELKHKLVTDMVSVTDLGSGTPSVVYVAVHDKLAPQSGTPVSFTDEYGVQWVGRRCDAFVSEKASEPNLVESKEEWLLQPFNTHAMRRAIGMDYE